MLDMDSIDRYANTVGYWVVCVCGNEDKSFSFLGDALRYYDDLVVSRKGVRVKRRDLNLPDEWVFCKGKNAPTPSSSRPSPSSTNDVKTTEDAKTARISAETQAEKVTERCDGEREECLTQLDVRRLSVEEQSAFSESMKDLIDEAKKIINESSEEEASIRSGSSKRNIPREGCVSGDPAKSVDTLNQPQRKRNVDVPKLSKESGEQIEDVSVPINVTLSRNKRIKPIFRKGEKVYAMINQNSLSDEKDNWLPGRVWASTVTCESSYGPVKTYEISEYYRSIQYLLFSNCFVLTLIHLSVFDNGEVEQSLDEVWVMKEKDYIALRAKPKEFAWIGVQRCTDQDSNDEYAKKVGWFETYCGEDLQIHTSISDAMRAHDSVSAFMIVV